jgi:chemotaxis protein methyltransferase CheR
MKYKNNTESELMRKFSRLIEEKMGLCFPERRWEMLKGKLDLLEKDFGFSGHQSLFDWMNNTTLKNEHIEKLASRLTIGETYFYRDKAMLDNVAKHILPPIIQSRRSTGKKLKIWSAGCSSGEEPYSIAIMLSQLLPDFNDWNINILATDINQRALAKAMSGVYKEWSFRGTPETIRKEYFTTSAGGTFKIDHGLKKPIDFQYLNLATDPFPSIVNNTTAFDFIFCRNVLMYFSPVLARKIIRKFHDCMLPGALLAVGGSEGVFVDEPGLLSVSLPQAILYKKGTIAELKNTKSLSGPAELKKGAISKKLNGAAAHERTGREVRKNKNNEDEKSKIKRETEPAGTPDKVNGHSINLAQETLDSDYEKALDLYKKERYTEALEILKDREINTTNELKAIKLLARLYANLGKHAKATGACKEGLELDKFDPECYYLQGLLFVEEGDRGSAEKSFFRAIYLQPDFELAHYAMANSCLERADKKKALRHFNNAALILRSVPAEKEIPCAEDMSAGRLLQIIDSILNNIDQHEKAS